MSSNPPPPFPPPPPSSPDPNPRWGPPGEAAARPGAPQGWGYGPAVPPPASQRTNALAVVAFVLSLVFAIPLVPLILGIVALKQINERGEKGKGFAVAAIVIHGLTLLLLAFGLVLGLTVLNDSPKRDTGGQVTAPGTSELSDLRKGDCFNTDDDLPHNAKGGQASSSSVDVVPCVQSHKGEAYAVFDLEDGSYPGDQALVSRVEEKCGGTTLTDYMGANAKAAEKLGQYYYVPTSDTWAAGDRQVICFLADPAGPSTGSVRAPGS